MTKQEKIIAGLIGVGAVLAILYLIYESNQGQGAAEPAVGITPPPSALPTYPNAQPIKAGDITIVNGSAPDSLNNVPIGGYPGTEYGLGDLTGADGCPCDCDPCEQVTTLQSKMTIPQTVFENAVSTLKSFQQKKTTFTGALGLPAQ